jgi:hypothetical protein
MIYLLKVGYQTFAFPDAKGLQTVIDKLSRAVVVEQDLRYKDDGISLSTEPPKVSMEAVPGLSFAKGSRRPESRRVLDPDEVIPPGAGGADLVRRARTRWPRTTGQIGAPYGNLLQHGSEET